MTSGFSLSILAGASSAASHERLRECEDLAGCSETFLKELFQELSVSVSNAGQVIAQEGEPQEKLYFLMAGKVQICSSQEELQVAELAGPALLGPFGLSLGSRHEVTLRALTFCDCRVIEMKALRRLFQRHPDSRVKFQGLAQVRGRRVKQVLEARWKEMRLSALMEGKQDNFRPSRFRRLSSQEGGSLNLNPSEHRPGFGRTISQDLDPNQSEHPHGSRPMSLQDGCSSLEHRPGFRRMTSQESTSIVGSELPSTFRRQISPGDCMMVEMQGNFGEHQESLFRRQVSEGFPAHLPSLMRQTSQDSLAAELEAAGLPQFQREPSQDSLVAELQEHLLSQGTGSTQVTHLSHDKTPLKSQPCDFDAGPDSRTLSTSSGLRSSHRAVASTNSGEGSSSGFHAVAPPMGSREVSRQGARPQHRHLQTSDPTDTREAAPMGRPRHLHLHVSDPVETSSTSGLLSRRPQSLLLPKLEAHPTNSRTRTATDELRRALQRSRSPGQASSRGSGSPPASPKLPADHLAELKEFHKKRPELPPSAGLSSHFC